MSSFKEYLVSELEEGKLSKTLAAVATSAALTLAHAAPTTVDIQQDDKTFKIEASFEIDAPSDIVYGVMTDFEHMTKFVPNLDSSKVISASGNTMKVQQKGTIGVRNLQYRF
jgi:uncharacterized membrane protein